MKTKETKGKAYLKGFDIAGFTYYEGAEVFRKLKVGKKLKMKAEPGNRYDANAVALYYKGAKLGYVPKSENKTVSKLLNMGHDDLFDAFINRVSPGEHPESQVGVTVKVSARK